MRGELACTGEMPEEPRPTAAYYREIARQIRAYAREVSLPEVHRELLDLAERFERMASFVEKRYPDRGNSVPRDGEADDT